jgi:hypothetical protein
LIEEVRCKKCVFGFVDLVAGFLGAFGAWTADSRTK